jgi:DNA repair photolyase
MHFVNAKGILSSKNGMNIYRGCTHGCIYCDSRSTCYQFTHDFENIEVKQNAPELLEKALRSKRRKCMIGTGSMSDPYMHCEEQLGLTRKCLEIIDQYGFGLAIITKSDLVLRDLDLIKSIQKKSKCVIQMTLTTYDECLCKIIEPNVCGTKRRFEVLKILRDEGIPTVVWMSPILPFINDTKENIEGILSYCVEAKVKGIMCFGMGLTLRDGNREYYYENLEKQFRGLKNKYHQQYGNSYEIGSENHKELMDLFYIKCKENDIISNPNKVFEYIRTYEEKENYKQMTLFEQM